MLGKPRLLALLVLLAMFGIIRQAAGEPVPGESLRVGAVLDLGKDLGANSSMFNPRSFRGKDYLAQINVPNCGAGRYPAGWTHNEALAKIGDGKEVRMACAFPAADYVLLAGGAGSDYFSRIDPNLGLGTRVFATNLAVTPSSYDWVDDDTIIHNSYKSGLRNNLYLTDVTPAPFQVTANTSWNANGYVAAGTTTRIRNVRVGDVYRGYAYYGDSGVNTAGFWAIDLATGATTRLGVVEVTGDGSWGVWTVKEVDGFLYVHTTHNGIYVYSMTDATTLGALHTRYTKESLDALTEATNPNWGFDVVDGGARMLLSGDVGKVIEIVDSRIADAPHPPDYAVDVSQTSILRWSAAKVAASHDVYFGTDKDAVADANTAADVYMGRQALNQTVLDPGTLEQGKTYFWRIDEVNEADPGSPWRGRVWTFTTADFIVVDDMESYTDDEGNRIYQTWVDGYPDRNGATVGNLEGPFVEYAIVHGGRQSMPLNYDNTRQPFYSEAELDFSPAQNWTVNGGGMLVLFVRGNEANGGEALYVAVEDSAGKKAMATHPDAALATKTVWTEWKIPLSSFAGVSSARVKKLYLGLGDRTNPKAGGSGRIYIDDIRIEKP
jgi:hypothetical protein